MAQSDITHRAHEALRLSEEPFLEEALRKMTENAQRELIELPSTAHEERWLLCCELKVIRGFRAHLRSVIAAGEQAAKTRAGVA